MDKIAPDDPMHGQHWPVRVACAMAIGSVILIAGYRWSGGPVSEPDEAAVATRELRFVDEPDGSIEVVDARDNRTVTHIVGESGFVRGTLRGLARERRRQGIGPGPAFDLVARADGRLTLLDPSTGRRVDLESFGATNMAEFARLLGAAGSAVSSQPPSKPQPRG